MGRFCTFAGLAACALIASTLAPAAAMAQSASFFDRNNNVGVLDRPRPDYQALGIDAGGFYIFPSLTLAPEYDDNIFATSNDRISDLVTVVTPSVQVQSNWARNAVSFSAQSTSDIYAIHSAESTTDYSLTGSGRLDIESASNLSAQAGYSRNTIARTSENSIATASAPIQYNNAFATLGGLQTLNRLRFTESVDLTRTVYDNESQVGSAPLSLTYLDGYQEAGSLRADYALNPEMSIFVNGTVNNRSYDALQPLTRLDRNSSGYQLLVGGSFDITRLLRGQVGLGYLQQDYQSKLFHTVSGPALNGNVEYFLSGLTTITVSANRSVIDAVDPTAVSFAQTAGALSVDHELLRNVLVSARISYETDDFTGIQRHDGRASASISGTYLLNRYMGLHLGYSLLDETSTGAARISDYDVNVVSLSLVLQL